jgi:hypothetical protein
MQKDVSPGDENVAGERCINSPKRPIDSNIGWFEWNGLREKRRINHCGYPPFFVSCKAN